MLVAIAANKPAPTTKHKPQPKHASRVCPRSITTNIAIAPSNPARKVRFVIVGNYVTLPPRMQCGWVEGVEGARNPDAGRRQNGKRYLRRGSLNVTSSLVSTGTGFPSFIPGVKRHFLTASIADRSRPSGLSTFFPV